jgi:hypothetical protein
LKKGEEREIETLSFIGIQGGSLSMMDTCQMDPKAILKRL